ncbi:MAG: MerR family transcriptional regulator [Oscillospiraceae bacterium]|nr:MerR family transcriptional regulator [Oscillospiraceae bacterium]
MSSLYPIREFSKLTGVNSATLRYWDEIGIFSPITRDPYNNYRYYSIEQVLALNFVTTLSELGISLKTISDLRKDRDPEALLKVLEARERELDMELRELRMRSSIIHLRQELIRTGLKVDETQISVQFMDEKALKIWPRNEYHEGDNFVDPLSAFIHYSGDYYVNLSFPVGGCWDSLDDFVEQPSRPQNFFSIDPVGINKREEGEYLVGYTRGYYAEMGDLPQRLAAYAKENNLIPYGPLYTMYLYEEICMQDKSQYLAQSFVAVKKASRY